MKEPKLSKGQSIYLDFLRAMAAMAVLFGHSSMMFLDNGLLKRMNIQSGGVMVFFLLSGFLISYSTFRKHNDRSYGFTEYFIDRFSRIYCAFLPALVFVWLADMQSLKFLPAPITPERLEALTWIKNLPYNVNMPAWFGNLFMLQDFPLFQMGRRIGIPDNQWFFDEFGSAAPFWTISIEWWIYMLFGAVVLFHMRDGKRLTPLRLLVLGIIAIEPVYYLIGGVDNCLTLLWLTGMGASLLFIKLPLWTQHRRWPAGENRWRLYCLMVCGASVFCMLGRLAAIKLEDRGGTYVEFQFGVFLALAVFSMLIVLGAVEKVPAFLAKPVSFIAGYSYSLYLTHATILTYLYLHYPGHDNDPRFFWIGILVSNIVAIVFWWLFERHYRWVAAKMKQAITKRRGSLAPA